MTKRTLDGACDGGDRGFSLLEAVIAAGLVAGACVALAQMLAISIANNIAARSRSAATVLAAQKMEQLREGPWEGIASGVDYLGQSGELLGSGGTMPPGAAFVRRWSAEPVPASPGVLVLHVAVANRQGSDAARLVAARTRRAP